MAIQNRRGDYDDFDSTALVEGEFAAVLQNDPIAQDGKAVYVGFGNGTAKRMATYNEISALVDSAEESAESAEASAATATAKASEASTNASAATSKASEASASALLASESAESAVASASIATTKASEASTSAANAAESAEVASASASTAGVSAETATTKATEASESAISASDSASIATTKASEANQSALNAEQSAASVAGVVEQASEQAELSESWAVGGTGVRTGEDTNNAHYWSLQAQAAAGGGVTSVNGQTGAVDLDAEDVGALSSTGDASNVTNAFTQASSRTNLSTGEKLAISLGKIKKWFADLKTVAFTGSYTDLSNTPTIPANTSDLTNDSNFVSDANYVHTDNNFDATYKGNVDSNTSARHSHSNKSILDAITAAFTTALKTKLDGIATGANKTVVDTTFSDVSTNPATSTAIAAWVEQRIASGGLSKEIVEALPVPPNIDTNTIYMVLRTSATENDIYNEYLNFDGTSSGWELIGSSAADLSDYYTKAQANTLFAFSADIGNKADLTTTEKGTVVGAINEINDSLLTNLDDISVRYNTPYARAEYKQRGADTWLPFSGGKITVRIEATAAYFKPGEIESIKIISVTNVTQSNAGYFWCGSTIVYWGTSNVGTVFHIAQLAPDGGTQLQINSNASKTVVEILLK